jgi:4-diphosphocytidyl-2-C-methyl-D-erythritol kinase
LPLLTETAPAKINLTLRVLGRRAHGYHELESLVAFADLADVLHLEPAVSTALELSGEFAGACGPPADNLVLKAASFVGLRAGRFALEKCIPVAAGLGGGSADAAAALRLIAQAHGIGIDDPRIAAAAAKAGADVLVCLESRARMMGGIGEDLSSPMTLPKLPALLVNPRVSLPTHQVFEKFTPLDDTSPADDEIPREAEALLSWLTFRGNDLTDAAIGCVPAVGDILAALQALPRCRLARMSGSGPTCFGLFDDDSAAFAAAEQLARTHGNWWICATRIG